MAATHKTMYQRAVRIAKHMLPDPSPQQSLFDVLIGHYAESSNTMEEKLRAATIHSLTCGHPAHMHGTVKIEWSPKAKSGFKQLTDCGRKLV